MYLIISNLFFPILSWCQVHFADSEVKVARASKQYIYDDLGNEYLDCVSSSAHGKSSSSSSVNSVESINASR